MSDVVQTLWGFCHTLRHDGIDYGDYIEQITYLLFIKMADERGIDLARMPVAGRGRKPGPSRWIAHWPALAARRRHGPDRRTISTCSAPWASSATSSATSSLAPSPGSATRST